MANRVRNIVLHEHFKCAAFTLIKYSPAAPPFCIWAEKTPQTSFKICGVGVCEKDAALR